MASPLEYDAKLVKELNIPAEVEVELLFKLAHVRTQVDEIKKFLWRERVELILGQTQADNPDELVAAKGKQQVTEHRSNIKQVVRSIATLIELQNALEQLVTTE